MHHVNTVIEKTTKLNTSLYEGTIITVVFLCLKFLAFIVSAAVLDFL